MPARSDVLIPYGERSKISVVNWNKIANDQRLRFLLDKLTLIETNVSID